MIAKIQNTDTRPASGVVPDRNPRLSYGGETPGDWDRDASTRIITVLIAEARFEFCTRPQFDEWPVGYTCFIGDLRDERLKLRAAIPVQIDRREGVYTAFNPDIDDFGTGDTELEALDDFRVALVDLYYLLKEIGEPNLGPLPLKQWQYLRHILKEE